MAPKRVNKTLSPQRFQLLRDLVAQGLSAADIAVNLSIDVATATEWKLVVDGPGALDAVVARDEEGVRVAVGTTELPEPLADGGERPRRRGIVSRVHRALRRRRV